MYQPAYQQYECDLCHRLIPKSEPVRFINSYHFCTQEKDDTTCGDHFMAEVVRKLEAE